MPSVPGVFVNPLSDIVSDNEVDCDAAVAANDGFVKESEIDDEGEDDDHILSVSNSSR